MIRRDVPLHRGLKIGSATEPAKVCVIREECLEDEMEALEKGLEGLAKEQFIALRRVVSIGSFDAPAPSVLKHLARVDFDLILTAQAAMDVQIATEAGLIPSAGGRDEPADSDGAAAGNA